MKNKKTKHMAECGHNLGDIQYNIVEDVESKRVDESEVFDKVPKKVTKTKVTKKKKRLKSNKGTTKY